MVFNMILLCLSPLLQNLLQKFLTGTSVNLNTIVQQCVLWQICLNIFHWDRGVAKKNGTIVNFLCFVTTRPNLQIAEMLYCFD